MSKRTDQVKTAYASLDNSDREEVKRFINEFDRAGDFQQRTLRENLDRALNKSSVGPRDTGTCGCCGKPM